MAKQSSVKREGASRNDKGRDSEMYQLYKQAKKHNTKAMGEAKRRVSDGLYDRLRRNEGRKIYIK